MMQRTNNIARWVVLFSISIFTFFSNAQIDFVHEQDTVFAPINRLDSVSYLGRKEYRYDYFYSNGAIKKKVFIINDSVRVVNRYLVSLGKPYLFTEYHIINGELNGKLLEYYKNGNPSFLKIYHDNRSLSYECTFYRNRQKRVEFIYDDEFRLKKVKKYNRKGKLIEESKK